MRLAIVYFLTLAFCGLLALGFAKIVGLWFPRATVPVFVALSVFSIWAGWQHAKWRSGKL